VDLVLWAVIGIVGVVVVAGVAARQTIVIVAARQTIDNNSVIPMVCPSFPDPFHTTRVTYGNTS
jgi:hypothetical protein